MVAGFYASDVSGQYVFRSNLLLKYVIPGERQTIMTGLELIYPPLVLEISHFFENQR
jgi:hypothetical protein